MVSECANPQCATPFRYLRKGSVLVLRNVRYSGAAMRQKNLEWLWLCENCAPSFRVCVQRDGRLVCIKKPPFPPNKDVIANSEVQSAA